MKNFYDPGVADELKRRIAALRPDSTRQWGKMNPAQAAAHLASALEMAVGDHMPPTMFLGRVFGRVGKWLLFRNDKPMVRNSPTVPELVMADPRDLERERKRLLSLVDRLLLFDKGRLVADGPRDKVIAMLQGGAAKGQPASPHPAPSL